MDSGRLAEAATLNGHDRLVGGLLMILEEFRDAGMILQELLLLFRRHALPFFVHLLAELHHALADLRMGLQEFTTLYGRHPHQLLHNRLSFALGHRGRGLRVKGCGGKQTEQ